MAAATTARKPIHYNGLTEIRFSDLDQYGHVNSKHYLDLVLSLRLRFMHEHCHMSIDEVTQRGIGFYLTRSNIQYRRSITGMQNVMIKSHVSLVKQGKVLVIPFEIRNQDESVLYSVGELEFVIIDLTTQKPTAIMPWMEDLLFE
jgi:YbgC/YbaW family acyl-CoA thioester hydrolase